jgi:hypothetical protein
MNDFHVVEICDCFESFSDDRDGITLSESSAFTDPFEEFSSCSQFCDDVKVPTALEPFVEFHDMGMMESFEQVHFIVDHVFVALDILFGDDLDGNRSIGSLCFLDYSVAVGLELRMRRNTFQPLNGC